MPFSIRVEPTGHTFQAAADETILAAALRQGVALPYSCRSGECGSCKGRVLAGTLAYEAGLPDALSAAEQAQGLALFCQGHARSDLVIQAREVDAARDITIHNLPCRVDRMERLCHDVMAVYLKLPQTEGFRFLAGQYLDIVLKDGRRRGFSIANAPHDDAVIELHIRHVPGGEFTEYVFHEMKEKTLLRIEGPLGTFFLREDSERPMVLMGGGTGFAPLKGMIEHAFHLGIRRPMHLYWGARARRDLYLDALPTQWAQQHANFRYTPVLSEPVPEDAWTGRVGLVHEAVAQDFPDLSGHDVYMSGPPAMVAAARELFAAHGLPPEQAYYDSFEFSPSNRRPQAPAS